MISGRVRERESVFQFLGLSDTQEPESSGCEVGGHEEREVCVSGVPAAFVGTGPHVLRAEQELQQWSQLRGLGLDLKENFKYLHV